MSALFSTLEESPTLCQGLGQGNGCGIRESRRSLVCLGLASRLLMARTCVREITRFITSPEITNDAGSKNSPEARETSFYRAVAADFSSGKETNTTVPFPAVPVKIAALPPS